MKGILSLSWGLHCCFLLQVSTLLLPLSGGWGGKAAKWRDSDSSLAYDSCKRDYPSPNQHAKQPGPGSLEKVLAGEGPPTTAISKMSVFRSSGSSLNPLASSEDLSSSAITSTTPVPTHPFDSWQFLILIKKVFSYIDYLSLSIPQSSSWAAFRRGWTNSTCQRQLLLSKAKFGAMHSLHGTSKCWKVPKASWGLPGKKWNNNCFV